MASYQDLSRRALIELNQKFDAEHDDILLEYLNKHIDELEGKTTVENVIEKVDNLGRTYSRVANKVIDDFFNSMEKIITDHVEEVPIAIVKTLGLGD